MAPWLRADQFTLKTSFLVKGGWPVVAQTNSHLVEGGQLRCRADQFILKTPFLFKDYLFATQTFAFRMSFVNKGGKGGWPSQTNSH